MIRKIIYKDVYKVLRNRGVLFVKGKERIKLNKGIFVNYKYDLFDSTFFTYIYNADMLSVYNSETSLFDLSYSKAKYLLGSHSKCNEFLLFDKDSNLITLYDSHKEKDSFNFGKNISIWVADYLITTSGKSLTKRNVLEVYNLNKDIELAWIYRLDNDYWFFGKQQVINSVLFLSAHKRDHSLKKFIGLNLQTGEKLWESSYEVPFKENLIALLLNDEDSLCYGLDSERYQVFDPSTGKVILQKDVSMSLQDGIYPDLSRQSIYDGKLWFVSGKGSNVRFGAMDLTKSEIEFVQGYPLEGDDQLDTPICHEGELYLRTLHSNALHILRRN
ncbi:hypothetical protein J9332_00880 [Aquimarina celericrescens]|nr:hypothetical protein [Aquimarina celericrescens]